MGVALLLFESQSFESWKCLLQTLHLRLKLKDFHETANTISELLHSVSLPTEPGIYPNANQEN